MTGHGQASSRLGDVSIDVEIRTVNNRYLKVITKVSEMVAAIEPQIESLVRDHLRRGTVNLTVRATSSGKSNAAIINRPTLESYLNQSIACAEELGIEPTFEFGQLLQLPGVLESTAAQEDEALLAHTRETITRALVDLQIMRTKEGSAMESQFTSLLEQLDQCKSILDRRAPFVITEYRSKLEQRVRLGFDAMGTEMPNVDLLREVLLYADRCDISEESTRLASHLAQFREAIDGTESQGRRMDFLIQELFREVNTIGSKANDSHITQHVITMKTIIEQMRELAQNVE